mgnify:CR=1 FL=1
MMLDVGHVISVEYRCDDMVTDDYFNQFILFTVILIAVTITAAHLHSHIINIHETRTL